MLLALVVAVALPHAFELDGPFIMDDATLFLRTARGEPNDPLWQRLFMYGGNGAPTAGRPVAALSVMLDFALTETPAHPRPRVVRAVNLAIHVAVVLLLFAWLHRVFERLPQTRRSATWLAWAVTLVWGLHPILASTVTFVGQRSETLASLGIVGCLYCATRADDAPLDWRWPLLATASAWWAVLSKELGAMVPLVVLVFDRALLAGSFQRALSVRRALYLGLSSTWPILAGILWLGPRTTSVGFDGDGITPLNYLLTQGNAIALYLRLLVVPAPLLIDYGWPVVPVDRPADLVPQLATFAWGLVVAGGSFLLGVWALWRRPVWGAAAALFFLVLAPSSSFIPIYTEIVAPHRMYLPSIVPIGIAVLGCYALGRRLTSLLSLSGHFRGMLAAVCLASIAFTEGFLTWEQRSTYRTDIGLFMGHLPSQADNPRLLINLGRALRARGDLVHSRQFLEQAVLAARKTPRPRAPFLAEASQSAAELRLQVGDAEGAAQLLRQALASAPHRADLRAALANALLAAGHGDDAIAVWHEGLRQQPDDPRMRGALIAALLLTGRLEQAREEARKLPASGGRRDDADAELADVARKLGRPDLAEQLQRTSRP